MFELICKFVTAHWSWITTLIGSGVIYKMFINRKIKTVSNQFLSHMVKVVKEETNNSFQNTKWDVYPGNVEAGFPLNFIYQIYFLFDTSKFYDKVLLRLSKQGYLDPDKDNPNHFTFFPNKNVNKYLFESKDK